MKTKNSVAPIRTLIATAALGAVALGLVALPAAAADSVDAPRMTVKFGDLNISSPAGAAALYARIKSAAESVCPRSDERELGMKMKTAACLDQAIARAMTQVNAPALSAIYSTSTGKQVPMRLAALNPKQ